MRIPHVINPNIFKVYEPSDVSLNLVPESKRIVKSEDKTWDETHIPKLTELCVMVIAANFENRVILDELPCWDRNYLLEILPTDLPLPLVVKRIHDEFYWKRKVVDRWKNDANYCQDYGFSWKRMYLERHVQEAVEAMTPEVRSLLRQINKHSPCPEISRDNRKFLHFNAEIIKKGSLLGFDIDSIANLCDLTKDYVKILNLRELQIMQPPVMISGLDEVDFGDVVEPCEHIDLGPIILGLENLTELHVQFGLRNVGSDYKKSWFQFSLQDCRNLGAGVAKCKNLLLLRVHSCNLDDDRLIALLSSMEGNQSLEEMIFSNCLIGDNGATAIAKYIKNKRRLKGISLCNNKIRENGISAIAFMITQSYASPLEYLNLKYNSFGDAGLRFLASALIRDNPVIKSLDVSCCDLREESGILLAETLNRNSVLTELNLSNNHLGESAGRALKSALNNNRIIQYLDLRMTEISGEDYLIIEEALFFNRIRALKGEEGVKRELRLREKRAEEERIRLEQEALAAARAAEEEAARLAAEALAVEDEDE